MIILIKTRKATFVLFTDMCSLNDISSLFYGHLSAVHMTDPDKHSFLFV